MAADAGTFKLPVSYGLGALLSNYKFSRRNFLTSFHNRPRRPLKNFSVVACAAITPPISALSLVQEFDPQIPIEEANTPPSSWYTDPSFYALELDRVFYRGWQAVGYVDQVKDAQYYFTGRLGGVEYVVCRDGEGKLHAFHNVCRHHASLLAHENGRKSCFVCPYHLWEDCTRLSETHQGWTYGLDGALIKATRIADPQKLNIDEYGLVPINVAVCGPFVIINLEEGVQGKTDADSIGRHWLGSSFEMLSDVDSTLSYVCRREYTIECNWKVYCDNYLDGGYHVPYAHKGLASGLKFETYTTEIFEKVSIQRCESTTVADGISRLGSKAFYAFVYPNFMINRYGPWMDTNLVVPLGPRKCKVVFDYFLDASLKDDKDFIENSLKDSEQVQMEDIVLCENVQRGIESPAYHHGRYAANVEEAMHHFHCLLHHNLMME
ncbi:hypothetical protein V2J09_021475 [Rumex salicifolius]